ncbi:class I SAM-dependent methyltransferase [Marivita hallyeonensis]|uniref:Methyltransferase domain-containing protein n=1 Tax=Marivita hallyeonensis TaxID=996342 RepID=A0A1M5S6Y2_9RHOB|nr:class I SAM-dependent methyltransferase [Marivita hallyeonensis]SHH34246.1 hypothetical protein SAMN05443551_2027 [Marivita hallyeonensis]
MSDLAFAPDWLDLREPADHAARDATLLAQASGGLDPTSIVLDLGSGTGSTARAFSRFGACPRWRFLDGDARLLSIATARHPIAEAIVVDLRDPTTLPLDGVGLVTSSALLDLMPRDWIEALARRLSLAGIPFYAALNYNGEMSWTPKLSDDARVIEAFNRHQLGDKGIGPATGPGSAPAARAAFERHGYRISTAESPWTLGPDDVVLQAELLKGIAAASGEAGEAGTEDWLSARRSVLEHATARIGHTDILAVPQ